MLMQEVADIVEELAPLSIGHPGDELGLLVGNPDDEVKGVATCWSPTLAVLEKAVEADANLAIEYGPLGIQLDQQECQRQEGQDDQQADCRQQFVEYLLGDSLIFGYLETVRENKPTRRRVFDQEFAGEFFVKGNHIEYFDSIEFRCENIR